MDPNEGTGDFSFLLNDNMELFPTDQYCQICLLLKSQCGCSAIPAMPTGPPNQWQVINLSNKWLPMFQEHTRNYPVSTAKPNEASSWHIKAMDMALECGTEAIQIGFDVLTYPTGKGDYSCETNKPRTLVFHRNPAVAVRAFMRLIDIVIGSFQKYEQKLPSAWQGAKLEWKSLVARREKAKADGKWVQPGHLL